jgi:hypothetical protein
VDAGFCISGYGGVAVDDEVMIGSDTGGSNLCVEVWDKGEQKEWGETESG